MGETPYSSVDELQRALDGESYLADRGLATAIYLALSLDKPLLLEGEAGVGKTEVAKVLSSLLGRRLIRLQCYEGIDASQALYEWNYSRQLIAVRAMDAADAGPHVEDLFGPDFLVERPLLAAIRAGSRRGAAGGRAGPRRRRVRGVPAGDPVGVRGDDPGARARARRDAAGGHRHVEPDPRAARRAEAPMPLPLDRSPDAGARGGDRAACARRT